MKIAFSKFNRTGSTPARIFEHARNLARSAPGNFLLAVALLCGLISLPLLTKANDDRSDRKTLTGNWIVTVTRINPPPGLQPTFLSLMTYIEDGNVIEESNTTAIRSTARGN
jgi:hypothetical protein